MYRKEIILSFLKDYANKDFSHIQKYFSEDIKFTNLRTNATLGQGYDALITFTQMDLDKGLSFRLVNTSTQGDFEVFTYEVTTKAGHSSQHMALYRFRGDLICEMILLDHD